MSLLVASGTNNTTDLTIAGGAARASLYDASGNLLTKADNVGSAGALGLPVMGVDHDILRMIEVSRSGRIEPPNRRLLFAEYCEGATLNGQRWTTTASTMTAAQAGTTGITLNSGAITTTGTGVALSSKWLHMRLATMPLAFRMRAKSTAVANQEWLAGLFFQNTLNALNNFQSTDSGAMWKFGTDGSIKPSLVVGGTEVALGSDVASAVGSNNCDYHVVLDDDRAIYQVFKSSDGSLISRQVLKLADTAIRMITATHVYTYVRLRNNTAPASAGQLFVSEIETCTLEMNNVVIWDQQLAENAMAATINPTTYAQAQQFGNSAAPSSATLSNTASSYSTLGGLYQFAALAGANTDYCLFGFQVPLPYRLKIKGVHISAWNTGAANAATPATMLMWGLGLNGASANLGTGGFIRRLLGQTTIPISAAIGAAAPDIDVPFPEPLTCEGGLFLSIILRVVAGAATASQIIQGLVDIRGVFE